VPKEKKTETIRINVEIGAEHKAKIDLINKLKGFETQWKEALEYAIDTIDINSIGLQKANENTEKGTETEERFLQVTTMTKSGQAYQQFILNKRQRQRQEELAHLREKENIKTEACEERERIKNEGIEQRKSIRAPSQRAKVDYGSCEGTDLFSLGDQ